MKRSLAHCGSLIAVVTAMLAGMLWQVGSATADTVVSSVAGSGSFDVVIDGHAHIVIEQLFATDNDGKTGYNLERGQMLVVNFASSNETVARVIPTLTFRYDYGTGNYAPLWVIPVAPGTAEITATGIAYNDTGGNFDLSQACFVVNVSSPDTTPPVVTLTPDRAPDVNGWYNHPVTFTATSDEPAVVDAPMTYSGPDSGSASVTMSATDTTGNTGTAAVSFQYDATAPTLNPGVSPSPVMLNGTAIATAGATDATSGLATQAAGSVDTTTVGPHTISFTATDVAGNIATATVSYTVVYRTSGVRQPVNADGTSVFKAGSTVPVKFQVFDANSNPIGIPGTVSSFKLIAKQAGAVTTPVNEDPMSTTPDTVFRYDPTDGQWIFNLSTKGATSGTKYSYQIALNDGTTIAFAFGLR